MSQLYVFTLHSKQTNLILVIVKSKSVCKVQGLCFLLGQLQNYLNFFVTEWLIEQDHQHALVCSPLYYWIRIMYFDLEFCLYPIYYFNSTTWKGVAESISKLKTGFFFWGGGIRLKVCAVALRTCCSSKVCACTYTLQLRLRLRQSTCCTSSTANLQHILQSTAQSTCCSCRLGQVRIGQVHVVQSCTSKMYLKTDSSIPIKGGPFSIRQCFRYVDILIFSWYLSWSNSIWHLCGQYWISFNNSWVFCHVYLEHNGGHQTNANRVQ